MNLDLDKAIKIGDKAVKYDKLIIQIDEITRIRRKLIQTSDILYKELLELDVKIESHPHE